MTWCDICVWKICSRPFQQCAWQNRAAIAMRCWHEDAKRLSPEGVAARAEGIAQTPIAGTS